MSEQTGPCTKCESEISTDARRCPECGYEPDAGLVGTVLAVLAVPVLAFSLIVVFTSILLPFTGAELSTAVFGIVFFGGCAFVSGGILYLKYRQKDRTPVDPSISSSQRPR